MEDDKESLSDEIEDIVDKKNILYKHLSSIHFHFNVIEFFMSFIPKYNSKMIKRKHQDVKVVTTEKWKLCVSVSLKNLLSVNDHVTLWNMARKMVKDIAKNKMIPKLQVVYMLLPTLNKNKAFREQAEKTCSARFDSEISQDVKRVTKKDNDSVLELLMFSENEKQIFYKVLVVVIY